MFADALTRHLQADVKLDMQSGAEGPTAGQADPAALASTALAEGRIVSAALVTLGAVRLAARVPGLKKLPMLEIILAGQVLLLAREHFERLSPRERHRIIVLLKSCNGRVAQLSERDRAELGDLIRKVEPRLFAESALRTLSPLPVPNSAVRGAAAGWYRLIRRV
jgi:hypothetical protein